MSYYTFDFCLDSRVAEVLAPEERDVTSLNGWDYTAKPNVPYRRKFQVTLEGLRWYPNGDALTDPRYNALRLEQFYTYHRKHVPFLFQHEYLGQLLVRFNSPLSVPKALPNSNGLCDALQVQLIHHNPSWTM